jgi:hypothetical protein
MHIDVHLRLSHGVLSRYVVVTCILRDRGGNDAELDGVDKQSSVDVARVVVIQQLGGHGGPWRGNVAA